MVHPFLSVYYSYLIRLSIVFERICGYLYFYLYTKIQKAGYIEKGIKGHSTHEESVQQGYAIVVGTKVIK